MKRKTRERIIQTFHDFDESDPDASTERLMMMTADACGVDYGDVAGALGDAWEEEQKAKQTPPI